MSNKLAILFLLIGFTSIALTASIPRTHQDEREMERNQVILEEEIKTLSKSMPCRNKAVGERVKHPNNDHKFLRCVSRDSFWIETCPDNLFYNYELDLCDWAVKSLTTTPVNDIVRFRPVLFKGNRTIIGNINDLNSTVHHTGVVIDRTKLAVRVQNGKVVAGRDEDRLNGVNIEEVRMPIRPVNTQVDLINEDEDDGVIRQAGIKQVPVGEEGPRVGSEFVDRVEPVIEETTTPRTRFVPTTTEFVPETTTAFRPSAQFFPPTTQFAPTTTTTTVRPTTQFVPTTTPFVPTTTQFVPTTTHFVPTTTQFVPTTTQFVPTTTQFVPTTTQFVPTTTQFVPTTTAGQFFPTTTTGRFVPRVVNQFVPQQGFVPQAVNTQVPVQQQHPSFVNSQSRPF
jgi:hypothetical protein